MRYIEMKKLPDTFRWTQEVSYTGLKDEVYQERVHLLQQLLHEKELDAIVIYGDREHFANIEYFSKFDCRFEEGLFILTRDGRKIIVAGNEGMPYADIAPYPAEKVLYQNFSLQGQFRHELVPLRAVLHQCGLAPGCKAGLVGAKYFEDDTEGDPSVCFDVPHYIVRALQDLTGEAGLVNLTAEVTGTPTGIRLLLRTANEIAVMEYAAVKSANAVARMWSALREGISELELSSHAKIDFTPLSVFPMINFGKPHTDLGIRSPNDEVLRKGDNCGFCYAVRGSLCARVGIAAAGNEDYSGRLTGKDERFYRPFWESIASWYELVYPGASSARIFEAMRTHYERENIKFALNPGHFIGMDEWVNAPFDEDRDMPMLSGYHLQCDIIGSDTDKQVSGICEDSVIVADEQLRAKLKAEYPDVYARIIARQAFMRSFLGINIDDGLLPLSNLNGLYSPYLLSQDRVYVSRHGL